MMKNGLSGICFDVNTRVVLYGLSTETERFVREYENDISILGLLDGFMSDGYIYGYPIITLDEVKSRDIHLIIVIARPGSCKVIAKRIGEFCRDNKISLIDVQGNDLLKRNNVSFSFPDVRRYTRQDLLNRIINADVVSFDLFDTLVTRTVSSYTDIFDILNLRLKDKSIIIPDFSNLRLQCEKELSGLSSPSLLQIYNEVIEKSGIKNISAEELSKMEWDVDYSTIVPRTKMCELLSEIVSYGKKAIVTTDCYFSRKQVDCILNKIGVDGAVETLVSCECGTGKSQHLYEMLKEKYPSSYLLHIGDDRYADIEKANEHGIESFHIYSGSDLFDLLGGLGIEEKSATLTDRIKLGLFTANVFNDPFQFESENEHLTIKKSYDIGYCICAPMISDFIHWMANTSNEQHFEQILFCARDGYLPKILFERIAPDVKNYYFLSSRTAAIRSGMGDERDIEYVDGMKYFGSDEDALEKRFGISAANQESRDRNSLILKKSAKLRKNYKRYIDTFDFGDDKIALFDFVAKGTSQLYLQKLFPQHLKGFYFLQLEPEYMADKGLDIEPFYTDKEKDQSSIYENYYILETILTAPHPQVLEFDEKGMPVYAEETRKEGDLKVIEQVQRGIIEYFERLSALIPLDHYVENKKLDESILSLINKLKISDEGFMSLTIEDPFFGRMTDIKDLIG